jgi:hypothetical protein
MSPAQIRQYVLTARRDELLTVQEFAYVAKQTPAAIYKRIARGVQSGVCRIGGEIRIDLTVALQPPTSTGATGATGTTGAMEATGATESLSKVS